jgi:hypothetical protein
MGKPILSWLPAEIFDIHKEQYKVMFEYIPNDYMLHDVPFNNAKLCSFVPIMNAEQTFQERLRGKKVFVGTDLSEDWVPGTIIGPEEKIKLHPRYGGKYVVELELSGKQKKARKEQFHAFELRLID